MLRLWYVFKGDESGEYDDDDDDDDDGNESDEEDEDQQTDDVDIADDFHQGIHDFT